MPHGIDRIDGFIRAQYDHAADSAGSGGSLHNVIGADGVRPDGFQRKKFTRRHLLERGGMKHQIHFFIAGKMLS
jgi:hypothetical protein